MRLDEVREGMRVRIVRGWSRSLDPWFDCGVVLCVDALGLVAVRMRGGWLLWVSPGDLEPEAGHGG